MKFFSVLVSALLASGSASAAASQTDGTPDGFKLALEAEDGLSYEGVCERRGADGARLEDIVITGAGPKELTFSAAKATCRIKVLSGDSRLKIKLVSPNGNVSRTATSGEGSVISFSAGS